MISFLSALQFLTILPLRLKNVSEKNLARSLIYFPIIGLVIGMSLVSISKFFNFLNFGYLSQNIILVIALIIITGGLHLDGLADSFDAVLSQRKKDEMLKIMRKPDIGAMGVLALISVILLKIAFLFSVNLSLKIISLLLMCILSRWGLVFLIFLFPYAREEGKAKIFFQKINFKIFFIATLITLILVIAFWKFKGILVFFVISVFTYFSGEFVNKKISGLTGDSLGALCELNELAVLLSIIILTKVF